MVRRAAIVREYHQAGALNTLLALWGFVDDRTFLTKAGHVGTVYRIKGVDCEGLTHAQRRALTHRFEAALRALDEHCRVYQYLIKQTTGPFPSAPCSQPVAAEAIQRRAEYLNSRRSHLNDLELFLVLLYEAQTTTRTGTGFARVWRAPKQAIRDSLSTARSIALLEEELDRAVNALHHKAQAFEAQLSEFRPRRLPKNEAFSFFRSLVNYDPAHRAVSRRSPDAYLDYFAADSPVECHRDHLIVGRRHVKVVSMKEPPGRTFAHVLADLYRVPGEFIACLEWQRVPSDRMRREIQTRRRHFFNKRVSLVN